MFTRILVPMDFGDPSHAAFEYAKDLAASYGTSLHLVHVLEDPIVTGAFGAETYVPESPGTVAALRADAESRLDEFQAEAHHAGLRVTSEVLNGPAAPTIVKAAGELAIDLIVMGTHGRTGIRHAVMGSIAERVVRLAPCPVLTVHASPQAQLTAVPITETRSVVVL